MHTCGILLTLIKKSLHVTYLWLIYDTLESNLRLLWGLGSSRNFLLTYLRCVDPICRSPNPCHLILRDAPTTKESEGNLLKGKISQKLQQGTDWMNATQPLLETTKLGYHPMLQYQLRELRATSLPCLCSNKECQSNHSYFLAE